MSQGPALTNWHPASWHSRPATQQPKYSDPAALERFYIEVLGLREVPKPAAMLARSGGMWFEGGIHIGIESAPAQQKSHPALVLDDFDAAIRRIVAAGFTWKDSDELAGVRRGHTRDPFGNRLELIAAG